MREIIVRDYDRKSRSNMRRVPMKKQMKKWLGKRLISMALILTMLASNTGMTVLAAQLGTETAVTVPEESESPAGDDEAGEPEETQEEIIENTTVTVNEQDSLGRFFAEALSAEITEETENSGNNIYSIALNGNEATVSFQTVQACTLVVAVYEDDSVKMLAAGTASVSEGDTEAVVSINIDSLPEFFVLKGFLVETNSLRPLGSAYESLDYTRTMQEFYHKTTADFDSSRILNLDGDASNNFLVFRRV